MHLRSGFIKRGVTGKFTICTAETLMKTETRREKLKISASNKSNNQIQTHQCRRK
jgi:predicted pyridoxine 5'-phosphate oxidase superfamily flavin-nucleotide-binding protein